MKNKSFLIFVGIAVVVGVLLYGSRQLSNTATAVYWPGTEVQCLQYGHQNIAFHIHPRLSITVDGVPEVVPANIGVTQTCMAEVHTHDASGEIHLESVSSDRAFTLADFFAVWGVEYAREGYAVQATINGEPLEEVSQRTLNDRDEVVITYTSVGGVTESLSELLP